MTDDQFNNLVEQMQKKVMDPKNTHPAYAVAAEWRDKFNGAERRIEELEKSLAWLKEVHTLAEWHEDDGPALWWTFPVCESPYAGSPLDSDWPDYHTHWTRIPLPEDV